jgi:hypothetical protein
MAKIVPLGQDNRPHGGFDPDLALPVVVTLATNLERLDLQYLKCGDVTFICMVLHYYRAVEQVAS